ncbi:threonine ammonia-lyase [Sporosarcina ureilytica]|uniref:threonine ammonia-lyase n=1 Tax=Sporosarcina ureilytica TaxID=298596 RepID=A0A1D8JH37_9BACL|nr:threonine/serine dehydratase [Sporosarcina ureilytica]AOV08003.1 serine/threonine dehydratase [Sporosarcina ureilytica]
MLKVTFQDVLKAAVRLKGRINETPLVYSDILSEETGAEVHIKMEALQKTGSFKIRGALNKIDMLTVEEQQKGVVTASAGNHAQAVAYASSLKGISAKIVVPTPTPQTKLDGIKRYGGELIIHGDQYDDAEIYALQLAEETGGTFINAFEDDDVIAGQGTAGLEAFLKVPDIDILLVPSGGGGLLCGVALVAKAINPKIRVIGIQTYASPPWYHAFKAGELVDVEYLPSYAEGLHGGIAQGNFDLAQGIVDDFVLVEEEDVAKAVYWMAKHHHYMLEGSAVVGITALQKGLIENIKGKKIVTFATGGNVDLARISQFYETFEGGDKTQWIQ